MPRLGSIPASPRESAGVLLAVPRHALVWDREGVLHPHVACPHGDEQRALDTGPVHLRDVLIECDAAPDLVRHSHLVHEVLVDPDLPVLDLERCVRIAHDVDCAVAHESSSSAGCHAACAGRGRGLPGDGHAPSSNSINPTTSGPEPRAASGSCSSASSRAGGNDRGLERLGSARRVDQPTSRRTPQ